VAAVCYVLTTRRILITHQVVCKQKEYITISQTIKGQIHINNGCICPYNGTHHTVTLNFLVFVTDFISNHLKPTLLAAASTTSAVY